MRLRILFFMSNKVLVRSSVSFALKVLIFLFVFVGQTLAIFSSRYDGYSSWSARLLYYTNQSNVWLGLTALLFIIFETIERFTGRRIDKEWLYVFKFVFTVSITMTGLVYCCLLAPFADDSYHVWSAFGVTTHVIVPVLAIADYFIDDYMFTLKKSQFIVGILPSIIYFAITSVLCLLRFDFGRGDAFPYFFMNFYSPIGVFGFKWGNPPLVGSMYWFILFTLVVLLISYAYARLKKG